MLWLPEQWFWREIGFLWRILPVPTIVYHCLLICCSHLFSFVFRQITSRIIRFPHPLPPSLPLAPSSKQIMKVNFCWLHFALFQPIHIRMWPEIIFSCMWLIFLKLHLAPEECPSGNTNCPLKDFDPTGFNAQGEVCKSSGKQFWTTLYLNIKTDYSWCTLILSVQSNTDRGREKSTG